MLWYIFIYFTIHLYCVNGTNNTRIFIENDSKSEFDNLSQCIKIISKMELKFQPTVAIDIEYIKDKTRKDTLIEIMASLLMNHNIPTEINSNRSMKNLDNTTVVTGDLENYNFHGIIVTFFETCSDVISFDFEAINRKAKYLIIIFEQTNDNCNRKLKGISKLVAKYDITFIFQDASREQIELFTFIPLIDQHTCKEFFDKLVHITTCFNISLQKTEVFPSKKPLNLNQCPLKVGMSIVYPFSQIQNTELLHPNDRIKEPEGSDVSVIKIVAEYFNATIDWRYILTDRNYNGDNSYINFVLNGSLDIYAGGLFRIYGDRVAYSGIYVRDGILWIYSVERSERSWANLVKKLNISYIFLLFYLVNSVIGYIICLFDGNSISVTNMLLYGWGALVGANGLPNPTSLKQKILNIGYMLLSLYFSAYISIQMFSFLTIREPPHMFYTQEDIMNSGRRPFLINTLKYFVNDQRFRDFANSSGDCFSFPDCVDRILLHNGLTIVLEGEFYNYQSTTAVDGEARILRANENILTAYHEMVIRKDSPLAVKFNRVINSLFEAGITERLFFEAIGILSIGKAVSANSNMVTNSYSCQSGCSITMKQFVRMFYSWVLGCGISTVVFIIELFLKNLKVTVN